MVSELWMKSLEQLRNKAVVLAEKCQRDDITISLQLIHAGKNCESLEQQARRKLYLPPFMLDSFKGLENAPAAVPLFFRGHSRCRYGSASRHIYWTVSTEVARDWQVLDGISSSRENELLKITVEGGEILQSMKSRIDGKFPAETWRLTAADSTLWTMCLFDLAWMRVSGITLNAEKCVPCPVGELLSHLPYDQECFRETWGDYPEMLNRPELRPYWDEWANQLPDCFYSSINDAVGGTIALIDWLLRQKPPTTSTTLDEDEIAQARQVCRANPTITRDALAFQLEIGGTKASLLLDVMRSEGIIKTKKRKSPKRTV